MRRIKRFASVGVACSTPTHPNIRLSINTSTTSSFHSTFLLQSVLSLHPVVLPSSSSSLTELRWTKVEDNAERATYNIQRMVLSARRTRTNVREKLTITNDRVERTPEE